MFKKTKRGLVTITVGLIMAWFMGSAVAAPEAVYAEEEDGTCMDLVDNLIENHPFYVWVKGTNLIIPIIEVTNNGDPVFSDFRYDDTCTLSKGNSNIEETYYGYRICAELTGKGGKNNNPESYTVSVFEGAYGESIGSDSFRWGGEDYSDDLLDQCCKDLTGDVFADWDHDNQECLESP